jgi:hypothetical protein
MTERWPLPKRLAAHFFMLALGPIHFGGELVDPVGNVHWHSLVYGILGTWLWALAAAGVWRVIG